ncbi:MAG: hypothetical protein KDA84_04165 [Planctomycetaceae bacterium]|nr:hypothetical protein [Planctomycetaceae bacterium]
MAYYHRVMTREDVKKRLGRLNFSARTLFALCCVTHGRSTFFTCLDADDCGWYEEQVPMIDDFWNSFPGSLNSKSIQERHAAASKLLDFKDYLEFESYQFAVGEHALIAATIDAFDCSFSAESFDNPTNAAYQIYWAIVQAEIIEKGEGTDESWLTRLEAQNAICRSEIDFQLKCLRVIENWQGPLPNYEEVEIAIESL